MSTNEINYPLLLLLWIEFSFQFIIIQPIPYSKVSLEM